MKKRLGDILLARGVMDSLQLQSALAFQRRWGLPLGKVVVDQGFCAAKEVFAALTEQTGMASVDLDAQPLDPRLARLVPLKVAEAHRVVPLRLEGARESVLAVAIAAPASLTSLDVVKSVSGKGRVVARLAPDAAIQRAIGRLYRGEVPETGRPLDRQSVALPEVEEAMALLGSSQAENMPLGPWRGEAATAPEQGGLPRFPPLEQEGLPLLSPLELGPVPEAFMPLASAALGDFEGPLSARAPARVLIHGWGAEAAAGLVRVLTSAGVGARVASAAEVRAASADTGVVAPLPSLEALGERVRAQPLVAGKAPERELERAQAVGARGFLAAPVDPDLLLRAVRRLLRAAEAPRSRAS